MCFRILCLKQLILKIIETEPPKKSSLNHKNGKPMLTSSIQIAVDANHHLHFWTINREVFHLLKFLHIGICRVQHLLN